MSDDSITRKLAAMLAGWIDDPKQTDLLTKMLDNERAQFVANSYDANSVAEDIMFAATRWSQRPPGKVREAGIFVLAEMVNDALHGTPWNTVNWATANLHAATAGQHPVLAQLRVATVESLDGQEFLKIVIEAIRSDDKDTLSRYITAPTPFSELSADDRCFAFAQDLWDATAATEKSC
jgi:hypothetical protein